MNYEKKQELITKHLIGWQGLETASIKHYAETGKISGNLSIAIHKMLEEYASQQAKEQWNAAIDAAAKEAEAFIGVNDEPIVSQGSILKLKKP